MSALRLTPPAQSPMARPDFLWGVATASFQIEGAWATDGRLPCIWGTFCNTPGKVLNGDTGEFACDHYHRYEADVELMADMGVDAYRLSIAWGRVMDEKGNPNQKGLDFYKRLLDALGAKGIKRYVTLYHWDLPQHLENHGGWLNRETSYRFAEYADLVSRELAGRVDGWMTLNEPWCSAFLGYGNGHHAPGKANIGYVRPAMHHLLLGHGLALKALEKNDPKTPRGIVANIGRGTTDTTNPADIEAARLFEIQHNNWVLDPLLKGTYPKELDTLWPEGAPLVLEGDMETINGKMDFLGINYYFRSNVRSDGKHGFVDAPLEGVERTQMGWEVYPQGLQDLLVGFKAQYGDKLPPIYITENGMASDDEVGADGHVHDEQRISFLNRHFAALAGAMEKGVDLRGYFCWSLMDNFEWAFGYERRFGLVHVDYTTQKRTLKDSALQFKEFLAGRK